MNVTFWNSDVINIRIVCSANDIYTIYKVSWAVYSYSEERYQFKYIKMDEPD